MKKIMLMGAGIILFSTQGYAMKNSNKKFSISSPVFKHYGAIPSDYTCDGKNLSPRLNWQNPPEGTKSFALICDDPDAPQGTFVHWVVYNIPATSTGTPEGVATTDTLADGSLQGTTSFGKKGFGGPCPPSGEHRYFFKLYAVDTMLALPAGATKEQLLDAMKGHIVAQAELVGTYRRKK